MIDRSLEAAVRQAQRWADSSGWPCFVSAGVSGFGWRELREVRYADIERVVLPAQTNSPETCDHMLSQAAKALPEQRHGEARRKLQAARLALRIYAHRDGSSCEPAPSPSSPAPDQYMPADGLR